MRKSSLTFVLFLSLIAYPAGLNGSCLSCDEITDNGVCHRSGVTKTCVLSTGGDGKTCSQVYSDLSRCPEEDD